MTGRVNYRLIRLIFLAAILSPCTRGSADEIQGILRYFGQGWSAGYHSQRPVCGQSSNQLPWLQSRHCLDRYSKFNFAPCSPQNCYGMRNGMGCCPQFTPTGMPNGQLPQLGLEVPRPPHPNERYPLMHSTNGTRVNEAGSLNRNQSSPLPRSLQKNADSFLIPPLEEVPYERDQEKTYPSDSGTQNNPFGVPGNSKGEVTPIRPGGSSFIRNVQATGDLARRPWDRNRRKGIQANPGHGSVPHSKPSNTFNGIR